MRQPPVSQESDDPQKSGPVKSAGQNQGSSTTTTQIKESWTCSASEAGDTRRIGSLEFRHNVITISMTIGFAIRQYQRCVACLACFPSCLCLLASLLLSQTLFAQTQPPQQPGAGPQSGTQSPQATPDLPDLPIV